MTDILKDFDAMKVLLWVVPGAFIVLFRSFAMRGTFPTVGKDDVAAFVLGSVVYYFLLILTVRGLISAGPISPTLTPWISLLTLVVLPALLGAALGLVEASDAIGRTLRKIGIRLPSPDATAWETLFREIPTNAVLLVRMKDDTVVAGCWSGGKGGSASSSDAKTMDLYLGQIGTIDNHGNYVPHTPPRGAYVSAGDIRFIEVIAV
jgi:hypothetical protein